MSYLDKYEQQNKEYGFNNGNGGFMKFEEGLNTIRILTEPEPIFEQYIPATKKSKVCYTGCGFQGRPKFMMYVYDYKDKQVKILKWGMQLQEQLIGLLKDDEYTFSDFPAPYDIKINVENAGTIDVKYKMNASRNNTEVPQEAVDLLSEKKKTIIEIIQSMKDKQKESDIADGSFNNFSHGDDESIQLDDDLEPANVPFADTEQQ